MTLKLVEPLKPKKRLLYCNFCAKHIDEVDVLIAAGNYAYICDQCVGLCNEVIKEEREKSRLYRKDT